MIKNVIFDFGCVLLHWSQHNLYDPYFGSPEKTDWFVDHICTWEWNNQTDIGKTFAELMGLAMDAQNSVSQVSSRLQSSFQRQ